VFLKVKLNYDFFNRIFTEDAIEDDGDNGDTPRRQLFFSSVQESDSGNYTCRATYTSSQTLSASVKLSTRVPIKWIDVPAEQHATLGEEYKVRCIVNANPAPQVRWLKDGVAISKSKLIILSTSFRLNWPIFFYLFIYCVD
jgi:hypothetical protein